MVFSTCYFVEEICKTHLKYSVLLIYCIIPSFIIQFLNSFQGRCGEQKYATGSATYLVATFHPEKVTELSRLLRRDVTSRHDSSLSLQIQVQTTMHFYDLNLLSNIYGFKLFSVTSPLLSTILVVKKISMF